MLYKIKTPNQVSQYLGNKNDSLKFGCNTLFLLTIRVALGYVLAGADYTQVSLNS